MPSLAWMYTLRSDPQPLILFLRRGRYSCGSSSCTNLETGKRWNFRNFQPGQKKLPCDRPKALIVWREETDIQMDGIPTETSTPGERNFQVAFHGSQHGATGPSEACVYWHNNLTDAAEEGINNRRSADLLGSWEGLKVALRFHRSCALIS